MTALDTLSPDAIAARLSGSSEERAAFVREAAEAGVAEAQAVYGQMLLDGAGVAFYAFPEVPKPKPYKDAYRARLDALPLDAEEHQRVLTEVKAVFGLNGGLFSELTEQLPDWRR